MEVMKAAKEVCFSITFLSKLQLLGHWVRVWDYDCFLICAHGKGLFSIIAADTVKVLEGV